LSTIEVETRVLKVCKAYDKVIADKVCKFYVIIISDAYAALQCQASDDYWSNKKACPIGITVIWQGQSR